jgi:virginiamycin B lyase
VPEQIASSLIVEYAIPTTSNSMPRSIVVESPGHVWFTMPVSNAIGSLVVTSTQDYEFSFHSVPTANSEPFDLAYDDSDGIIWFTERAGNKIGRLEIATGNITEFLISSTVAVTPTGIAVAPNGDVWFTENGGNKIGRFDPGSSLFEEFPYPASKGHPEDVAVETNDSIWFTAPDENLVVNLKPSSNTFKYVLVTQYLVAPFPPGDIVIDSARLPWVTAPSKDWIGPFFEGTLAIWRWHAIPTTGGRPTGIAHSNMGGTNYIWFVETDSGRVGHMAFDSRQNALYIWDQPTPSADSQPRGIAVDANGHAWITESGGNMIAEWRPPYFFSSYLPAIQR